MIDNPDGTKRLPTKEEILENVNNRRQSIRADNNSSQTSIGTNQGTTTENRRFFSQGRGETFQSERRDRLDESNERSGNGTDGSIFGTTRTNGNIDSSVNKYSERATTTSASERTYEPPIRQSKFKPYADAVRQALKNKKKETVQTKVSTKKVLTKQEADSLKEKLVEVLLWQSDHADEFIV